MNRAHDLLAEPPGRATTSPATNASWYTQGTSDGLGDRLLMFDNTAAASLELLRFRPALANAPGFEHTLLESVQQFSSFKHPSFDKARSVHSLECDVGIDMDSTPFYGY